VTAHALSAGVRRGRARDVFLAFLRLGVTSFGGPVAHLGYFNEEFVRRRGWLDQPTFAQVVALCQFLPGPASSQAGMIIGLIRGGTVGAALAWCGFTLPSAALLVAFALGVARQPQIAAAAWVHGLLIAAVAVVGLAVTGMYRSLCPDIPRRVVAFAAAALILLSPANGLVQLGVMALGALYGLWFVTPSEGETRPLPVSANKTLAAVAGAVFAVLLAGLAVVPRGWAAGPLGVFGAFYEAGALVFGGGHVVLPLLQARVVPPGWVDSGTFLAGYGAAQAVPGPLFTFAAYLGAAMHGPVRGIGGAAIALLAIYLPSFLLIAAILPFWNTLVRNRAVVAALQGVNAAVVGVLLAALYQPVWVTAVRAPADVAIALLAYMALGVVGAPPWLVVVSSAAAAQLVRA